MKKRKQLEKEEARARRDRLIEKAQLAQLPLIDGLREMRTISGLTQAQFAEHRGVSARAIKALELGQGNPTVSTLNRIAAFYGLEVAFVPSKNLVMENVSDVDISNEPHPAPPDQSSLVHIHELQAALVEQHVRIAELFSKMDWDRSLSDATQNLKTWARDIRTTNPPDMGRIAAEVPGGSTRGKIKK